jgi:hypothetical protein
MIVINNATSSGASSDILIGSIVLWYGSASAVPSGFSICNGTGGSTPDLRGRFIRGASNSSELLTTGGSSVHLHAGGGSSYDDGHSHAYDSGTSGGPTTTLGVYTISVGDSFARTSHTHTISAGYSDGDGAHTHVSSGVSSLASSLPPYRMLYWIKRIT